MKPVRIESIQNGWLVIYENSYTGPATVAFAWERYEDRFKAWDAAMKYVTGQLCDAEVIGQFARSA